MLINLVEEMTCKWERQLEETGEGRWTDGMLGREGTSGEIIVIGVPGTCAESVCPSIMSIIPYVGFK